MVPPFKPGTFVPAPTIGEVFSLKERAVSTFVARHNVTKLRFGKSNVRYSADDLNRVAAQAAQAASKPPQITGAVAEMLAKRKAQ
jgi:hypothetical protein